LWVSRRETTTADFAEDETAHAGYSPWEHVLLTAKWGTELSTAADCCADSGEEEADHCA
jgi:hypothetical protein